MTNERPTHLDLFSGIGGFSLAFERAGFRTIGFAETDDYASAVLRKHWPNVHNYGDVRNVGNVYQPVSVITGGFPCQDISIAGRGAGIDGKRSGMWFWMLEVIKKNKPPFCLIENVPALRTKGADRVFDGLARAGYTAEPFVVGAIHAGAKHRRGRVWIVCYTNGANGSRSGRTSRTYPGSFVRAAAQNIKTRQGGVFELGAGMYLARSEPYSGVLRNLYGIPCWLDRLRCLGNAVVPQIAEVFARFIYQCLDKPAVTWNLPKLP